MEISNSTKFGRVPKSLREENYEKMDNDITVIFC